MRNLKPLCIAYTIWTQSWELLVLIVYIGKAMGAERRG